MQTKKESFLKYKTFTTIFIILMAFQGLDLQASENNKIISVRADEWLPFNGKPNSKKPGYLIEVAKFAFEKQGYTLDYQLLPWERSLEQVSKGEIDCVVSAFKSDAPNFIFPEESFGKEDVAFYGRIDSRSWKYASLDSFKGLTIAVIGGYSYGNKIDFYLANSNNDVHIAKGDDALEQNIKMLLSKRVDILLESPSVFEYKSQSLPSSQNIKELDRRNEPDDIYFACSPANITSQGIVDMLDQGISELRQTGELIRILTKYGLKDWEE